MVLTFYPFFFLIQTSLKDNPQFYHRSDDTTSFAANGVAVDSSGRNRPGTYGGSTDGLY